MEIPVQLQHPRNLCRRGTPSPLTPPKTTTLLTHVPVLTYENLFWRPYRHLYKNLYLPKFPIIWYLWVIYNYVLHMYMTHHIKCTMHQSMSVNELKQPTQPCDIVTKWLYVTSQQTQLPKHYKPVHSLQVLLGRPLFWWVIRINSI